MLVVKLIYKVCNLKDFLKKEDISKTIGLILDLFVLGCIISIKFQISNFRSSIILSLFDFFLKKFGQFLISHLHSTPTQRGLKVQYFAKGSI